MPVDRNLRNELLASVKRLQDKGYLKKVDVERDDLPVGIPYEAEVPIRGNVHFGQKQSLTRREIDKRFAKQ